MRRDALTTREALMRREALKKKRSCDKKSAVCDERGADETSHESYDGCHDQRPL